MIGITKKFDLGDGREVTIETGKLAKQADGAVVVRMGDTMLLATVCCKKEAAENVDFMPLQVEYQEKYAAVGRFPGGFFKRESRPSEYEILIARLVDRALRPLFPDDFHAETQVLVTLMSGDKNNLPDALACLAASSALAVSDIPFLGPISEVRVGRIDGQFVINPTVENMQYSDIDMIVAASMENIMMVEGEMKEISEADMVAALNFAHEAIKIQCQAQLELAAMVTKANPKREYCHENNDEELREAIYKATYDKVLAVAKSQTTKHERGDAFEVIFNEFLEAMPEEERVEKKPLVKRYYHDVEYDAMRSMILNDRTRLDGRALDQVRPIWVETDYLPSVHGSAIFTRGETQSLTTCTLGTKLDEQTIDGAVIEGSSRFILHYNFPPFSVGEVKRIGSAGRREIGHGNLAHRAIKSMIPFDSTDFPYTVRMVSDILESNGSSSMATVCAGILALMDCGVKIKKPVSGIAMGLITDEKTGKYAILSDILGDEDHLGDMDFKVCGTKDGITACQMDIKINGLSSEIMAEALEQARRGRLHILEKMNEAMPEPREDYKPFVPRIVQLIIPKEYIGAVIGTAGKVIQELQRETNTVINIEEKGGVGIVDVAAANLDDINRAVEKIKGLTTAPEVGEVYDGVVKGIQTFGAFVEFLPNVEGLLHVSEIDYKRIDNVADVLKEGDEIKVKLIAIDDKGKFKLSHRALLPKPEGWVEPTPRPARGPRPDRGDRNDRGERGERRPGNGNNGRPPRRF
ncbi:MAG: polyribonucleotide nucleotidyltransferase [Bacteroidetes bacterium]|nr:polyribonucleotide nucleotidyltransferase [Bacteroidota bacterium]MCL2302053.1 polyribonucleotide nucleotidyltransferase [Lentimicrobiaceae bacterium]MCL2303590.1 polyribonucleotide nucleotidyltransferase [Lentimicrobiaceae bacterium]